MIGSTKHLVIIGGNAAGLSAARRARRNDPKLKITVLEKFNVVSYAACGIPYFIADLVKQKEQLIALPLQKFLEDDIEVKLNHEVVAINKAQKVIFFKTTKTDELQKMPYHTLVLATGATPVIPHLPGVHQNGVYAIRSLQEAEYLKKELMNGQHKTAVIVGAGYIGLEMAEALAVYGLKIYLIEQKDQLLPYIDPNMAQLVEQVLQEKGITVLKSTEVSRIVGQGNVNSVQTSDGQVIACSLVILALGVRPNVTLAQKAGIELGATGAIRVDDHLRTNVLNVYAAGDCAEVKNVVTNKYEYIPLGTTANKQGRVVGDNVSGKRSRFAGVVGAAALKVFQLEVARAGLTEAQAAKLRLPYKSVTIKGKSRAGYYPQAKNIHIKLIFNFVTGRLLGVQMVGEEGVAKRLDVVATALQSKLTVQDLCTLDLTYAPPFAPVWDPILIAANQALKQLKNNR